MPEGDRGERDPAVGDVDHRTAERERSVPGVEAHDPGRLQVLAHQPDERAHAEALGLDRHHSRVDERRGGDGADGGRDDRTAHRVDEVVVASREPRPR